MPKVYDQTATRERQEMLGRGPVGGKEALRHSLRGVSYEAGVQAIGFDPNLLDVDPEDLGLDPQRLNEDLSATLKELYPAYELFLRVQPMAMAVGNTYCDEALRSERGTADGRFSLGIHELVTKTVDLCRDAEFTRGAGLAARQTMSKEQKRRRAAKADQLLKELQRLMAAMTLIIGQVSMSTESTRVMQLAMVRLVEAREQVSWFYRTFRSEGFEWSVLKGAAAPTGGEPPR